MRLCSRVRDYGIIGACAGVCWRVRVCVCCNLSRFGHISETAPADRVSPTLNQLVLFVVLGFNPLRNTYATHLRPIARLQMNRRSVAMPATLAVLLLVWAAGSCEATNGRPFAATSSGAVPAAAGPKAAAAVDECAADGVGDAEQLQRKGPRARAIRFDETEHVELRNGHPKRLVTFIVGVSSVNTICKQPKICFFS